MISGFSVERSEAQFVVAVMLLAQEVMIVVHCVTLAAQVASRVWVIRVTDLEAWKKEVELCEEVVLVWC